MVAARDSDYPCILVSVSLVCGPCSSCGQSPLRLLLLSEPAEQFSAPFDRPDAGAIRRFSYPSYAIVWWRSAMGSVETRCGSSTVEHAKPSVPPIINIYVHLRFRSTVRGHRDHVVWPQRRKQD
ncbi:uncharacterized protein LAESUDRAFT_309345 [Laetiporus sulphureus 93-53]|uniref:Uncharacterized protein n=1 Tax=Laetiporus sulphureus 93-53 TaxID=1314785 RepID=A0A165DA22_9APHY|nr:uncharacterized protein LAESUDRAFT_309345 [Laetiporus sulphureus 93-53]KZT04416.1 hypothetical protein LAESUDRAFT_309345 [Laetiporus sulphureus 93-53]